MSYRVLVIIPARSGSKGLRHKNSRKLGGVPLLVRAVALAQGCARRGEDWRVVVSTDSPHYARIARRAGAEVPWLRPGRLATDHSRLIDAVLHALDAIEDPAAPFAAVLMLSATTPLTTARDVRAALRAFRRGGGESVVSVCADIAAPSWRFQIIDGHLDRRPRRHGVLRRQVGGVHVVLNGAIYVASPGWLRRYRQFVEAGRTQPLVMPRGRSLDIETAADLALAEVLLGR